MISLGSNRFRYGIVLLSFLLLLITPALIPHLAQVSVLEQQRELERSSADPKVNTLDIFGTKGYQGLDDNYEPNNDRTTAYDLTSLERNWLNVIDGYGYQHDDDWYEIEITSGYQSLDVALIFTHSAGNLDIAIYTSGGSLVTSSSSQTDNEYIDTYLSGSGTYYIRVYGFNTGNSYNMWWDDTQYGTTPPTTTAPPIPPHATAQTTYMLTLIAVIVLIVIVVVITIPVVVYYKRRGRRVVEPIEGTRPHSGQPGLCPRCKSPVKPGAAYCKFCGELMGE